MTRARRYANHKGGRKYDKKATGARVGRQRGRGRGAAKAPGEGRGQPGFPSRVETVCRGRRVPGVEARMGSRGEFKEKKKKNKGEASGGDTKGVKR